MRFFRACRRLPAALLAVGLLAPGVQAFARGAAESPRSRTEVGLLGTSCTITIYSGYSEAALDASFARIAQIEERMTVNRDDSEVLRVNRAAGKRAVTVSADTFAVISRGLEISRMGNGAFDITVGPLVKLWGIGTAAARVPSVDEIRRALALVSWREVTLSPSDSSVMLRRSGMALDLGAIAKGYAADEVVRILREHGVRSALVNLGGNVLTLGAKPDRTPWKIGVQNPEEPRGTHIGIVDVGETAVVTSGTYERFFEKAGRRYHHILDTATGAPVDNGLAAVMIVTPSSTTADGWSTLVFALGLERGRALVEATGGEIEALFVTTSRDVHVTPGLRKRFRLTDPRFTLRD
jgi:FAD:protein FMN transferase